jgi:hypothetical protein
VRYLGQRKGAVLIVVLGVLAVLALLGVTFATLQATERQVARNYLDTVRAKLAAQSGIQAAEAQLREYFPNRYFEGIGTTTPLPKPWKFWGDDPSGAEVTEPLPDAKIDDATNPSFAVELDQDPLDSRKTPKLITINGRKLGMSGTHGGGFYGRGSEHYVLKVSDISGRIYVNDGVDIDPTAGANTSVSLNLKRILNALGDQISVPQLGNKIIAGRPPGGYRHMNDLLKAVSYDEAIFARFRDYVTVHAWVDTNVVNPVPLSGRMAAEMENRSQGVKYYRGQPPIFRHGSAIQGVDAANVQIATPGQELSTCPTFCGGAPHDADAIKIYGLDVLNPQYVEVVARAPVNVNAASKQVLVALLADLQGYFVAYHRRNNPRWKGDLYLSFKQQNALRPKGPGISPTGDEYGYLMETVPIVAKAGTMSNDEISAYDLADHIIACRERRLHPAFNYGNPNLWWTGPFRSWHQFYAFVDNLAKPQGGSDPGAGVLIDRRTGIHQDYEEETDSPSGEGKLVPSTVQAEHATKALADVLKANFNPNCHLNELNPDENLYLRVDKTDLFVNSTEFCFMPTGYFEIEALGRVVRPVDPKATDVTLGANKLVAQAKVKAIYKLYDMVRETTQKHFYAGVLAPRGASWDTNNNLSLEVGPEPDNGEFPGNLGKPGEPDNEFDGYISLPTVGGLGVTHPKNTMTTTKQAGLKAQMPPGLLLYVPFTLDQDAGFHAFGMGQEIASEKLGADDTADNWPDIVGGTPWPKGGPYNPTDGSASQPVRAARSFRLTKAASGTTTMPGLTAYPPSDLRLDGTYVERHAAPAYFVHGSRHFWQFDNEHANGQIAMWWKPSYYPDLTGKVRTMWDMSRYHDQCGQSVNVWPWALWYFPSNYDVRQSETQGPKYWHNNCGQFEPSSLCFGSKQWHSSSSGSLTSAHEFGHLTACLNHLGHDACRGRADKVSPLRGHRWMHTAAAWDLKQSDSAGASSRLWINGTMNFTKWTYITMTGGWNMGHTRMYFFDKHDGGEYNQMRFGATSYIGDRAKTPLGYKGNHTGDQTIDELYVWKTMDEQGQLAMWARGRYYKPDGGNYGEGFFTSAALELDRASVTRNLPQAGSAVPPGGLPSTTTATPVDRRVRILGVAWTWYGEVRGDGDPDPTEPGRQVLYAYDSRGMAIKDLNARIGVSILDGTNPPAGPYYDDTYSPVYEPGANGQSTGASLSIQDPKNVKYRVNFDIPAQFSDILLATPVLDDVTIFYDDNQSHLLSFVFDNRSF